MPRLIVLNGPPAAGKSTLARRWVEEHPLALALDVDVLREMLGGRRADPHAAGLAALAGAAYVEVALVLDRDASVRRYVERWRAGRDVVHGRGPAPDVEQVAALHERVVAFVAGRPHVRPVAGDGEPDAVYARLAAALADRLTAPAWRARRSASRASARRSGPVRTAPGR